MFIFHSLMNIVSTVLGNVLMTPRLYTGTNNNHIQVTFAVEMT